LEELLYSVASQKIVLFIGTAVGRLNLTEDIYFPDAEIHML
jgi:hypothetical protein